VHLHNTYKTIGGRITAENLKEQVLRLLKIWESWLVFPAEFTSQLYNGFMNGQTAANGTQVSQPTSQHPTAEAEDQDDIDGIPLSNITNNDADEDIDGVPIDLDQLV
jgi:U2-associated protein SR140